MQFFLWVYSVLCSGIETTDSRNIVVKQTCMTNTENPLVADAKEEEKPTNHCKNTKYVGNTEFSMMAEVLHLQSKEQDESAEELQKLQELKIVDQLMKAPRHKLYEKNHDIFLDCFFETETKEKNFKVDQICEIPWMDIRHSWCQREEKNKKVSEEAYKKSLSVIKGSKGNEGQKELADHFLNLFIYHASTALILDVDFVFIPIVPGSEYFINIKGYFSKKWEEGLYAVPAFDKVENETGTVSLDKISRFELLIRQVTHDIQGTLIVYRFK